ncbi:AAA family ATPase [Columbia Basin potato purple top phytoplasma]|uniref:ATP-dependent Zn protease n=1 Tax=Columbia Basin potato purple top phytoplasma TaxID=307134 RepID=A0ABT5LAD1_9MOLU|nr:AAA family ATPase [Columbia Basin potato purple top phytoplasma]MDC9032166.1 ATP-dependent Zn protease [Columbia Basin potato purple top phytoplasma]
MKKKINQNSLSKHLMITIILLFFSFCLGTYVWVHHQTLTETEKQIINHHKRLENQNKNLQEIKTQIHQNQNELKKEITTQNNEFINEFQTQLQPKLESLTTEVQQSEAEESFFKPSNPQKFLSFDKLIGFKKELKAVEGFLDYLKNKDNYQGIGEVEPPLGILMYGCPGTGKNTLARALSKEAKLPFFEVSSSLFSQKYKGLAPQMVKDLFEVARKEADKKNGAIIFLDECETIFTDLATLETGSEIANVVNQFKTEMTSFENNPAKPIFIIGATNHVEQIDEAIKSRFTYNIEVKPGNKEERKKFLEFMINKRQNPYSQEAKQYLLEIINEALENLPKNKSFLKANRTLENLLKTTVTIFAQNRGTDENKRNEINSEDLKQAYQMIISQNIEILEQIENQKKGSG